MGHQHWVCGPGIGSPAGCEAILQGRVCLPFDIAFFGMIELQVLAGSRAAQICEAGLLHHGTESIHEALLEYFHWLFSHKMQ